MRRVYLGTVVLACFLIGIDTSCNQDRRPVIAEGEQLARTHCVSCHQFSDPSLLDKKTWSEGVLPKMAELMNIDKYYDPYNPAHGDARISPEDLFPYEKWEKIVSYYLVNAPDSLPGRKEELPAIQTGLKQFTAHFLNSRTEIPVTTMVRFDTAAKEILYGDGVTGKVLVLDAGMKVKDSFRVSTGIADIHINATTIDVVTMGIMRPSDAKLGKLTRVTKGKSMVLMDSLQRPVQATYADLNADKKEDIVLCEFGYRYGALSWLENMGDSKFKKHILRPLPGAISSKVYDFNKDGKPDIVAMMAQADEGVFIYYNEGNGRFREERVLSFPPVYGSNSMQLCDFNNDGFMDILTTNGDNADFSIVFKPYHGIRLFLNDGKNHFTQYKFLPVYGVQQAVAADMDNDGDLDIASVSFFPDYEKLPQESFIYWENIGNNNFRRCTFEGVTDGRWMTLDAGDMDHDGDKDIILASGFIGFGNIPQPVREKWKARPLAVVILENTLIAGGH